MTFFTNKNLFQKIMIALFFVLICVFLFSGKSYGFEWGGALLKPIAKLLLAIEDGIMDIVHRVLIGQYNSAIHIRLDVDWWTKVLAGVAVAVLGLPTTMLLTMTYIKAGSAVSALKKTLGSIADIATSPVISIACTIGAGLIAGTGALVGVWSGTSLDGGVVSLPLYGVTPERIFSGEMAIFDVDFFNPNDEVETSDAERYSGLKAIIVTKSDVLNPTYNPLNDLKEKADKLGYKIPDGDLWKRNMSPGGRDFVSFEWGGVEKHRWTSAARRVDSVFRYERLC